MCDVLNISEPLLLEYDFDDQLIEDVYNEESSIFDLPYELYLFTFLNLITPVYRLFGLPSDQKIKALVRTASRMKNSVSIFSGAKTFQNVLDLSMSVFDNQGNKRPLNEFKKIAKGINEKYNVNYIRTENNLAFRQSEAVAYWEDIQNEKDIFPFLRYNAVNDARTRDEHEIHDGVLKRVDDPFWNTWFPPNGWNCRCIVERVSSGTPDNTKYPENKEELFSTNVGKTGVIFPKKHPYNQVPKEFREAKKNNFGLKALSDNDIKKIIDGNN